MLNWDFLSATCFSRTYSTIQSWPLNIIIFIRAESFQSFKVLQLRQTSGKRGASESLTQSHQHKPSDELCLSAQGFIPPPSSAVSSISGLHWGGGGPSLSNTAGDLQQNNMDSFHSPTARQCLLDLNISFHCKVWRIYYLRRMVDVQQGNVRAHFVSWQNVHEENGQANVEQDNHADHDGVWALRNTWDMRSVSSVNYYLMFNHKECPQY